MRNTIRIHDKEFELFISAEEIATANSLIAVQLNALFSTKHPLFIIILNGAYIFGSDLTRKFKGNCDISFSKIKSYNGMNSGEINEFSGFSGSVANRHVVLIEDIVDTGKTLFRLLQELELQHPSSITTVALFQKNVLRPNLMKADIFGFEIPDKFIVGYGLDYDGLGRNLPDVWMLRE